MTAEQGDVETIREALLDSSNALVPGTMTEGAHQALAALDRLAAALERAERERDEANELVGEDAGSYLLNMKARAEKAERALAENEQMWEDMRAYNIRLEERVREAERALAEIENSEPDWARGTDANCEVLRSIARTALRPSEDTGNES